MLKTETKTKAEEKPVVESISKDTARSENIKKPLWERKFYRLFWMFFVACFLGVLVENIWCILKNYRIESRQGLIYGPFNLVYGIGALMITFVLQKLKDKNFMLIFLGGSLLGAGFEYACSWIQEIVFGTVSWQYDGKFLNLHGRITLSYSFFWGLLAILWLRGIAPLICRSLKKIKESTLRPLTIALLVFIIFDSLISAAAVYRMSERKEGVPAGNIIEEFLDTTYPDDFLQKIYPNMTYVE